MKNASGKSNAIQFPSAIRTIYPDVKPINSITILIIEMKSSGLRVFFLWSSVTGFIYCKRYLSSK